MTDEEYVLAQTNKERAIVGRSAFHKKNGARSKKCNFPSDYLTKKERLALNSDCVSYPLNSMVTLETWKSWPLDIQVQYINLLINKYKVGLPSISMYLLGKSDNFLTEFATRNNISFDKCPPMGRGAKQKRLAFIDEVQRLRGEPQPEEKTDEEVFDELTSEVFKEDEPIDIPQPEAPAPVAPVTPYEYMEIEMRGAIDVSLLQFVMGHFEPDCRIKIIIQKGE